MSNQDFIALSPLLILACSSVLVMLLIAVRLSHRVVQLASFFLFGLSFISIFLVQPVPHTVKPLFIIDDFSLLIIGVITFSSLIVNILSYVYFEEKEEGPKEYYVLLFLSTLGAAVLAASNHFISLFLGLETLTVALYALIAYLRARTQNIEAGIKYLILAAFSSAFLLFGMALVYLESGSMEFSGIANSLSSKESESPLFITGLGMMLAGIGFKLAVVPFHMWTADVYQGAPAPVSAFIATASKGGVFAVLLRFFIEIEAFDYAVISYSLIAIAIASMVIGNFLALQQTNVKRILAYSSIAHLGYLLVSFLPGTGLSAEAVSFYIVAYSLSILAAFGVVTILSTKESDAEYIGIYKGLFWNSPLLACVFSSALLSLAGIPLTAGFIGKFYVLSAGVQDGFWFPAIVLVLSSVVGLYYYLRIITTMFSGKKSIHVDQEKNAHPIFYLFSSTALSILTLLIVWLGVYPTGMISFIQNLFVR